MDEPQEDDALVLLNGSMVVRRNKDGGWVSLTMEDTWMWATLESLAVPDRGGLVRLIPGETGPTLHRERAIRVDIEHPRRKEKVGTYITHWADPRLIDQAPNVWKGWTIVERWTTDWEEPA